MTNLIVAVVMECVYQALIRDLNVSEERYPRVMAYQGEGFTGLCFLCIADPEQAKRRLFP